MSVSWPFGGRRLSRSSTRNDNMRFIARVYNKPLAESKLMSMTLPSWGNFYLNQ